MTKQTQSHFWDDARPTFEKYSHLEKCNWSQTEAAKHLNVALSTLNQKIQRLNIDIQKRKGRSSRE